VTIHDLTFAIEDSIVLLDIAKRAGVSAAQVRMVAAALGNIPVEQAIRLCSTAHNDRIRQANRTVRKAGER
jgi:hypothetical protein